MSRIQQRKKNTTHWITSTSELNQVPSCQDQRYIITKYSAPHHTLASPHQSPPYHYPPCHITFHHTTGTLPLTHSPSLEFHRPISPLSPRLSSSSSSSQPVSPHPFTSPGNVKSSGPSHSSHPSHPPSFPPSSISNLSLSLV
ncbi:hypothetical protein E2C01_070110 [Portunus trituberculatus]|uniref:Uncharacterized protein n=1 Tax=Portunus trituberculatus TaxID=210409 RepID=A0A5B7I2N8_PORTR|nr:hypothetical protein [Portunus trituberculatus]